MEHKGPAIGLWGEGGGGGGGVLQNGSGFTHTYTNGGGGGGTTSFEAFFMRDTYVLVILKWCTVRFRPFNEGGGGRSFTPS